MYLLWILDTVEATAVHISLDPASLWRKFDMCIRAVFGCIEHDALNWTYICLELNWNKPCIIVFAWRTHLISSIQLKITMNQLNPSFIRDIQSQFKVDLSSSNVHMTKIFSFLYLFQINLLFIFLYFYKFSFFYIYQVVL